MSSGSIRRGEFELRYYVAGTGLPTLVIGSSIYYPRSFSKILQDKLRLAFIDWRGFGKPLSSNRSPITFETILEDIESMRAHLGFEKVIVMGHSAHALIGLEYAKKYPERVSHVVMVGISPNLSHKNALAAEQTWEESVWPERKAAYEERLKEFPDAELAKLPPAEAFVKWNVRRAAQSWYDYSFDSSKLWEGIVPNMDMLDYLYRVALPDLDITKGLDAFDKPVFLALGRFDFILAPSSSWDPIRPHFQDLTVRIFERSGHSPQFEESEHFDQELLKWIFTH